MKKKQIHFSHANGYPAGTYEKMFSELKNDFNIGCIDKHGHNPKFPVEHNWDKLSDELISYIKSNYSEKIIGIGHSLGGVLNFLAAIKHPELFEKIILIDSPILGKLTSFGIKCAKSINKLEQFTPAKRTLNRTAKWNSKEDAFNYFSSHSMYKHWDSDCIQNYINSGTQSENGDVHLSFKPEVEYSIYQTLPTHLPTFKHQLNVPCHLFYGKRNTLVNSFDRRSMKKYNNCTLHELDGGHLLPMEYPLETARKIREICI